MKKKVLVLLMVLLAALTVVNAEALKPYRVSGMDEVSVGSPVSMAGDKYTNGYYDTSYGSATLLYNLKNQYRTMTCLVGPMDRASVNKKYQVDFYVDNVLAKTVVFTGIDLPIEVEIDLNYMRQLRVTVASQSTNYYAITNIDFK